MTPEKRETAIKWLTEEIRYLRMAPKINGCGPENWQDQLEIMETCLEAVRAYPPAHIGRGIWVNASERMPEDGQIVLVTASGKPQSNITLEYAYELAEWSIEEGWILNWWPEWEGAKVTHWMPLPEPPAELEKRLRGVPNGQT